MKISTENIQKKSAYIAPQLTEVEFRVERGFADSESGIAIHAANMERLILGQGDTWVLNNQNVGGNRTNGQEDNGLAAGDFYFYNTQPREGEGGWF